MQTPNRIITRSPVKTWAGIIRDRAQSAAVFRRERERGGEPKALGPAAESSSRHHSHSVQLYNTHACTDTHMLTRTHTHTHKHAHAQENVA